MENNEIDTDIIIYYYFIVTSVFFIIFFILAIIIIYKMKNNSVTFYLILFFIFTLFIQNTMMFYAIFNKSYKEGWQNSQCSMLYGEYAKNQYKIDKLDEKYTDLKKKMRILRVDANKYKNIQKNLQTLNYSTNRIYNKKTNRMIIQ